MKRIIFQIMKTLKLILIKLLITQFITLTAKKKVILILNIGFYILNLNLIGLKTIKLIKIKKK
jgi:hypothetical protein